MRFVSVLGAITSSDRTNAQQAGAYGHGDKATSWGTGLKYDANSVYLAAIYTETRNMTPISGTNRVAGGSVSGSANKAENLELVAQYQFDFGLRPSIGYVQTKGKDIENGIGNEDLVKYIDVGATYYFNKNMSTTSTKTCRPLLITKLTNWIKTTSWRLTTMTLLLSA